MFMAVLLYKVKLILFYLKVNNIIKDCFNSYEFLAVELNYISTEIQT